MAEAVDAFHPEAGVRQAPAHRAGGGEGGQGGARAAVGGELLEQGRLPHGRVARRRETVQEPGVHPRRAQPPQGLGVAEHQRQGDVVRQPQPVAARRGRRILVAQGIAERVPFRGVGAVRPGRQRPLQILGAERVLFHREQIQPRPRRGPLAEQGGGQQHVQAGAEAGLADHEAVAVGEGGEALTQAVAVQEHIAAFGAAILAGKIGVVVVRGHRSVVLPVQARRMDRGEIAVGHVRAGSSDYCRLNRAV